MYVVGVAVQKLQSTDAFVVRDFGEGVPALGIVRSAPKILQGGAKELARSQTYQCAVFNIRFQGASAGVNALPETRADALAAFAEELLPFALNGELMLDPGKGVSDADLAPLTEADPRDDARLRVIDGLTNHQHLTALGAVVCAEEARPLSGATVAIESFETLGPALARAAADRGASITTVATAAGVAACPDGFDVEALCQALAADGSAMVSALVDEPLPAWQAVGAEVDVLFAGSKMGLLDHRDAPNVKASLEVPTGPIPYTTKGALMIERQGTTLLPDFVTTAGALFSGMPPGESEQESIEKTVAELLSLMTRSLLTSDQSPILEACHRAEAFLATWRDELPFGRPFAP